MTNAKLIEKIKNFVLAQLEINKRISKENSIFAACGSEDETILRFLSTLESEKPISQNEDFEKEIADYWITMGWSKVMTLAKFKVIARYFYGLGLGINEKSEKPMNQEGLEEEIDRFYGMYRKDGKTFDLTDNEQCVDWKMDCNPDFEIAFARHFAKWGAEHLKK